MEAHAGGKSQDVEPVVKRQWKMRGTAEMQAIVGESEQ
jgi:hypothetical protein